MNSIRLIFISFLFCYPLSSGFAAEPSAGFAESLQGRSLYVVERERSSLAVIGQQGFIKEIGGLGRLHHATMKFMHGYGWIISRDGYLSRIDLKTRQPAGRVRVGKSAIGLTAVGPWIAVANYDPGSVVIVRPDLTIIKTIPTGSRTVGIKTWKNLLVYSLMDADAIEVRDRDRDFALVRRFEGVGRMPFDALIAGDRYLAGFWKDKNLGLVDLKNLTYSRTALRPAKGPAVLKVPHFGMWGMRGTEAWVPAVGRSSLQVVDTRDFSIRTEVPLPGLPVFAVLSPDGRTIAVNYSGDQENLLTVVSTEERKVIGSWPVARRVMHMRFASDGNHLFLSSWYDNKVKVLSTRTWKVLGETPVPGPSGLFLIDQGRQVWKKASTW